MIPAACTSHHICQDKHINRRCHISLDKEIEPDSFVKHQAKGLIQTDKARNYLKVEPTNLALTHSVLSCFGRGSNQ